MYKMKTICVLMFIMLLPTIQSQNGEFDSWPGNVSVLLAQPLTLTWTHSLSDADIEWCYYQFRSPETSPDEFLGWDNNLKKRLNISDNQLGWRFLNVQYPCLGGIERDRAESQHAGNYRFYVITTQGEEYFDSRAHITVVEGAGLSYSLTVGEKEHKFDLSEFDTELETLEVTEDDTLPLKLKLLEGFAPSNLSILKQDKGWEPASVTCSQKHECQAPFSANKDTIKITASIETSVQGISQIRINQPISYSMKDHSVVPLVVAVVFVVLFLLLLIILLICLCNKRARRSKKVRRYLLRKHDDLALKEEQKNLRSDVETLTNEKSSLQIANRTLDERNRKLDEEIDELKKEKETLLDNLNKKTVECSDLEKEKETLLDGLEKKTTECSNLAVEKSDLQDQLGKKERELTKTKQEAQGEKDQHADEVRRLKARIAELERQPKKPAPGKAERQESGDAGGELEFINTFDDQLLAPGAKLFLSVTFSRTPRMVSWFRDGKILLDGVGNGIKLSKEDNNTYSLRIKEGRVKPGMYLCQAKDQRNIPIQHEAQVSIGPLGEGAGTEEPVEVAEEPEEDGEPETSPPEFTDTSDLTDKYLTRNTPLKLSVAVSGLPMPTVTWYRGARQLYHSPEQTTVEQREGACVLTINPGYGTVDGQYSCVAESTAGRVQSDKITVQSGRRTAPTFVERFYDTKVREGSKAFIQAKTDGFPPPEFKWFKDHVPLSDTDKIKIVAKKVYMGHVATLTIEQFSVEHAGLITLEAANDEGSDECSANLRVSDTATNAASPYGLQPYSARRS